MHNTTQLSDSAPLKNEIEYVHFHGFNSTRESSTGLALQSQFGEKLWRMEYDYIDPDHAFDQMDTFLVPLIAQNPALKLIGNSLGGFWANYFGNKYSLSVVLINPCYQPSLLLQKYLGANENHYTHEIRVMQQSQIDAFAKFELLKNQAIKRTVIISEKDETIPPLENIKFFENCATIITCPNETHQFRDMKTLFAAVAAL